MSNMGVLGEYVYITVKSGGTAIAGFKVKSDEIKTKCGLNEKADPSTGQWRVYTADRKEWSISTGYLVSGVSDIGLLLNTGTLYDIEIYGTDGSTSTKYLSGSAFLETCVIKAQKGYLLNGSFAFTGSGPLA